MFPGSRRQKAEGRNGSARRRTFACWFLVSGFWFLISCRQKMADQPRYDPLESSNFFADGMASRPRIAGTVARGELPVDGFAATGKIDGADGDGFPFPVTAEVMNRGEERFNIFCSTCHGRVGDGNGMIPARGYRRPPSFHSEALRAARSGHFFDVMTNGFGSMPSYAAQVSAKDRWAIVAYIRALQLSQNGTINDLPQNLRASMAGVSMAQPPMTQPPMTQPPMTQSSMTQSTTTGGAQ
ncbi:MAG: c-type cytochrome [Thermoanaerobaculia bacterium]